MAIGGKKREVANVEFTKKVGVFEANVIAINPDAEFYKDVLGMDLKEDSKALEYLSNDSDGGRKVRIDVWLKDVKSEENFKVSFFVEENIRVNKDGNKFQFVNSTGLCSWADKVENLPTWFTKSEVRNAYVGEEELITFFRTWLGKLDFRDPDTELSLDINKLLKGNVREWVDEIDGEYCQTIGCLATIKTVEKEDGPKSYQNIYNKAFFPGYSIKFFRLTNYDDPSVIRKLSFKTNKDLKPYERFVLSVVGEYGCKDYYTLNDLQDYDSEQNITESSKVKSSDDADY